LFYAIYNRRRFSYGFPYTCRGQTYETLAICRTLALARDAFAVAIADKP
jgi:hypothetical protein